MDAYEIQRIVLECLREAEIPRVLKSTIYSLSDNPAEAGRARKVKRNMMVLSIVASRKEFETFNKAADERGVHLSFRYRPQRGSDRLIYDVFAVEKR